MAETTNIGGIERLHARVRGSMATPCLSDHGSVVSETQIVRENERAHLTPSGAVQGSDSERDLLLELSTPPPQQFGRPQQPALLATNSPDRKPKLPAIINVEDATPPRKLQLRCSR